MAKQDMNAPQREPWPVPGYWDRRAPRTAAGRQGAFQRYLELSTGRDKPWHAGDIEARRDLFYRRYIRPNPPAGMSLKTLAEIRGDTNEASAHAGDDPENERRSSAVTAAALARTA